MFSIFSKKSYFPVAELLKTDMHSHILPGIDDGAKTTADSLQLIDGMIEMGFDRLICTPHIMADLYPNTPETIHAAFLKLQTTLKAKGYTIPVSYAAEYLVDEKFEEKIAQGLLCLQGNLVLIETMFSCLPFNIEEVLFRMEASGYRPVLAHPERYHYMDKHFTSLQSFEKYECCFQPNILSFTGYYGPREKDLAERFLAMGKVDFLGSDVHHMRHLKTIKGFQVSSKIAKKLESIHYKNAQLQKSKTPELQKA